MKADPALIRRLLPALRRIVRFPGRDIATVSTETSVELSELQAWFKAHGHPTEAKVEALEDALSGQAPARTEVLGTIPDRSVYPPRSGLAAKPPVAASASTPAPPPRSDSARNPAPVPAPRAPSSSLPPLPPVQSGSEPWLGKAIRSTALAKYRPALERVAREPAGGAFRICTELGVRYSGFCSFCRTYFAGESIGKVSGPAVTAFLAWADHELGLRGKQPGAPAPAPGSAKLPPPDKSLPASPPTNSPSSSAARLGSRPSNRQSAISPPAPSIPFTAASDSEALFAIMSLRDKYVAELERLEKTVAGVERAIVIVRAKVEAGEELLAVAKGGTP